MQLSVVEDALFEKVTARPEPRLAQTVETRRVVIGQLAQLMERAQAEGYLRAEIGVPGMLLITSDLTHVVLSA